MELRGGPLSDDNLVVQHRMLSTSFFKYSEHCNENPIYVFPEKELRGLSPNFQILVSVSDLCIPRIGPHIFLQQNRQTDPRNI